MQTKRLTPEEYLAIEGKVKYKGEYWSRCIISLNGDPPELIGANVDYVKIVSNLTETLSPKLKKQC